MDPNLLEGKKVVGTEGYILGEIEGIDIDLRTWEANAFCVSLSDESTAELGLKKTFLKKIIVCFPTELIKAVGEVITLKEPIRNLEDIEKRGIIVSSPKLKGKKVIGAKGFNIGEVEGFDIELANWQVTGLKVVLTDEAATELGFKIPFLSKVVVIIPTNIVSLVSNFVTLDETIQNIESIIECIKSCQKRNQN